MRYSDAARIALPEIVKTQVSKDGTKKILFGLEDGLFIESVLIPGKNHWTVCVSTQVGCQMGCAFCMTGRQGFKKKPPPFGNNGTDNKTPVRHAGGRKY